MKTIIVTHNKPKEGEINPQDIENIIDGSIDVIGLGPTLDYVEKRDQLLTDIVKKLRYNGTIELVGSDVFDIARGLYVCELNLDDAHNFLYNGRQSCDTLQNVVNTLEELGLKVNIKRIHKFTYYVKATRTISKI